MYAEIKNNTLMSYAHWAFSPQAVEVDIDYGYFVENKDKFAVVEGVLTDISETDDYKAEKLAQAKALKLDENKQKRDERIARGVAFKGERFEIDADNKINLYATMMTMSEGETVLWSSADNAVVELSYSDVNELYALIMTVTEVIWAPAGLNTNYLSQIQAAQTLEELENINIDYSQTF